MRNTLTLLAASTRTDALMADLSIDTIVARGDDLLDAKLDDEVVLLRIESGDYYGFNAVASRIWELIETPQTFGRLVDALLEEFEVSREQCREDVAACLGKLSEYGLAKVEAA